MTNTTSHVVTAVNITGLPMRWETLSDYMPLVITGLLLIIIFLLAKLRSMAVKINKLKADPARSHPEGYDKFVAESREWAFDYIEQVQTNLQELVDAAEQIDKTVKKLLPNK